MPTVTDERPQTNPSVPLESHPQVRVVVAELLQGGREAILEHAGSDYRLRITANGKLILTK
jgi:hemin uptake protein HemP